MQLQQVVNESVFLSENGEFDPNAEELYIDLANLDFDKLKSAFAKTNRKNTVVYDLQKAIEQKLKQMVRENPLRLEFYEKYKEIIDEYNKGKDLQATQKAFDDLMDFMEKLDEEDKRAIAEGLDVEALAIFDLLRKNGLTKKEEDQVKQVAIDTLTKVKEEKLKIERWRESIMIAAQVKTLIYDSLQYLPQESYPDNEVDEKADMVYQHIYTNYPGGMTNVYNQRTA